MHHEDVKEMPWHRCGAWTRNGLQCPFDFFEDEEHERPDPEGAPPKAPANMPRVVPLPGRSTKQGVGHHGPNKEGIPHGRALRGERDFHPIPLEELLKDVRALPLPDDPTPVGFPGRRGSAAEADKKRRLREWQDRLIDELDRALDPAGDPRKNPGPTYDPAKAPAGNPVADLASQMDRVTSQTSSAMETAASGQPYQVPSGWASGRDADLQQAEQMLAATSGRRLSSSRREPRDARAVPPRPIDLGVSPLPATPTFATSFGDTRRRGEASDRALLNYQRAAAVAVGVGAGAAAIKLSRGGGPGGGGLSHRAETFREGDRALQLGY